MHDYIAVCWYSWRDSMYSWNSWKSKLVWLSSMSKRCLIACSELLWIKFDVLALIILAFQNVRPSNHLSSHLNCIFLVWKNETLCCSFWRRKSTQKISPKNDYYFDAYYFTISEENSDHRSNKKYSKVVNEKS